MERRKHARFSATAFLNRPVLMMPMPPYIGKQIRGKLIDLSAGGLALLIPQIIPLGTKLHMKLTFPDQTLLACNAEIRHMLPRERNYLHGLQFEGVASDVAERIEKMSADYIDCEQRIMNNNIAACIGRECAFFTMCTKQERTDHVLHHEEDLLLSISQVIS
jgi:c-di-GMP-binding flagellar brake protein YcgR